LTGSIRTNRRRAVSNVEPIPSEPVRPKRRRVRIESHNAAFYGTHVFIDDVEVYVTKATVTIESRAFTKVALEFYAEVEFDGDAVVTSELLVGEPVEGSDRVPIEAVDQKA
jgi:hypothetical protein